MDHFGYRGESLHAEERPLAELAVAFGTPLYVYSQATVERHYAAYANALAGLDHRICYAVKANGNLALLRLIARLGGGADVVSAGELYRCLEAGIPPERIVFSGVGKTLSEIEYALRRKVFCLNVESASELGRVAEAAGALGVTAPVALRINPDVDPKTHPYTATGLGESKFGIASDDAVSLYRKAAADSRLRPTGVDLHIGSQMTDLAPFTEAIRLALDVVGDLRRSGIGISHLDCGGGLGVIYRSESPPTPAAYAGAIRPLLAGRDLTLLVEPGRSIVGNAGVLLTRVLYVKRTAHKTFVVVDAAMNDLVRPALYGAEHEIVPVLRRGGKPIVADVVGPVCESGDFLARGRSIEEPREGDLLCVRTAGAYGFSMSSQYNARPRAAEVWVAGERAALVRRRETLEDLVRGEEIPEWLEGE